MSGQWPQQWHSLIINLLYFAINIFCTKTCYFVANNGINNRCIAREMITAGLGSCRGQGASVGLLHWYHKPCLRCLPHCTCCWFTVTCAVQSLWSPTWPGRPGASPRACTDPLFFCLHLVISAHQEKWLTHCESFNVSSLLQVSNCIDKSLHPLSPSPPPQLPL